MSNKLEHHAFFSSFPAQSEVSSRHNAKCAMKSHFHMKLVRPTADPYSLDISPSLSI